MSSFIKTLMTLLLTLSFITSVGCNNNNDKQNKDNSAEDTNVGNKDNTKEEKNDQTSKSKYPFPDDTTAKGKGEITLSTPAGTSENGKAPVLFVSKDDMVIQIGLDAENFDGSKQSFVYVDKAFSATEQFGELTQTVVNLENHMLNQGIHKVSVVQFENDDPKSTVTSYTEAKYEAKEKK
ncbi:hypothetical protein ACWZQY_026035 [Priestia megaterium]